MKRIIILFFPCFFLFACNRSVRTGGADGAEMILVPNKIIEGIENMVSEYEIVPLEANDNSLLGGVGQIRIVDDKVFVLDRYRTGKLVAFDRGGNYLYSVGQRGRGPGEYLKIYSFEIDYVNREMLAVDVEGRKIIVYDLDGNLKRTVKFDFIMGVMAQLRDGTIVNGSAATSFSDSPGGEHKLLFFTPNGKMTEKFLKDDQPVELLLVISDYLISKKDGSLSFAPQFHDMIYDVTPDGPEPVYRIEYSADHLTKDKLRKMQRDDFKQFYALQKAGERVFTGTHALSPRWVCLANGFGLNEYVFYDRAEKKSFRVADPLYGKDLTIDDGDWIWASVSLVDLQFPPDKRELAEAIRTASENTDDNPVLVRYKLK